MSLKALHQRALSIAKTNTRTVKDYQKGYVAAYKEVAATITRDIAPSAIANTKRKHAANKAMLLCAFLAGVFCGAVIGVLA